MKKKPITQNDLKWLLIDFDKTVADNTGYPDFKLSKPMKGAKKALEKLTKDGWKITIYTARAWGDYEKIEAWMKKYKMPYRRIICGKPLGGWLIDDRALHFNGDWKDMTDLLDDPLL